MYKCSLSQLWNFMILDQSDLEMLYNKNSWELFWNQLKANLIGHVPWIILHKLVLFLYVIQNCKMVTTAGNSIHFFFSYVHVHVHFCITKENWKMNKTKIKNIYSLPLELEPYTILAFHLDQKTHVFVTHILIGCSYIVGCIQLKP